MSAKGAVGRVVMVVIRDIGLAIAKAIAIAIAIAIGYL